ncbi:MAG: hypothetical protein IJ563_10355, partial [Selenomonadaceae bacterium]|nr:hypothetical protein [Selenomonadaceae bacterium]
GYGNDSINAGSNAWNVTLNGGSGNDTLTGSNNTSSSHGDVFQFGNYDDYNVITNYGTNDTINFTGIYSSSSLYNSMSGSDRIIYTKSGYGNTHVTLKGAASKNIKVKLAGGSMTTIYGSRYFEERDNEDSEKTPTTNISNSRSKDFVEEHWFTEDNNFAVNSVDQLDSILDDKSNSILVDDNLLSEIKFGDNNDKITSLTYSQKKVK